uniref:Uncharacterized protein n=1 Tax=Aegilops tauschii subsp. strangulata TaxID=200361 RepID=A0A453E516_AEGTS
PSPSPPTRTNLFLPCVQPNPAEAAAPPTSPSPSPAADLAGSRPGSRPPRARRYRPPARFPVRFGR